ncbi:MAG: hypothetical protein WCX88_04140 [Patescibacteria group bacterium]
MTIIPEEDLKLLKAYIAREAMDYNPAKDKDWESRALSRLLNKIIDTKINYLTIESLTHMGAKKRSITIEIEKSYTRHAKDISFMFSPEEDTESENFLLDITNGCTIGTETSQTHQRWFTEEEAYRPTTTGIQGQTGQLPISGYTPRPEIMTAITGRTTYIMCTNCGRIKERGTTCTGCHDIEINNTPQLGSQEQIERLQQEERMIELGAITTGTFITNTRQQETRMCQNCELVTTDMIRYQYCEEANNEARPEIPF